ncbi:MAG TPA: hypothetical protein HPP81_06220 [Deltaproteobacteria bacterium]|jgi:hypothetical protein|nr:hypothetical protein [Deltaproteobacteria bacterium]
MSRNRKRPEPSPKSNAESTPSLEETYLPELDTDLQLPYNVELSQGSERQSETTALPENSKPLPIEKAGTSPYPRNLTASEIESLREDMKAAGRQMKGRFYMEGGKVRLKPPPMRNLTPSEIESLKQDTKEAYQQLKGRSRHLPQNKKPA